MAQYTGTTGDDSFVGTNDDDDAFLAQGGRDQFRGEGGDDYVAFGATFGTGDKVVGGAGYDTLELGGDYSAGLTFASTALREVEEIALVPNYGYRLNFPDGNIASEALLVVRVSRPTSTIGVRLDASSETNGDVLFYGAEGNDALIGGAGNDLFRGNGGRDVIVGGAGIDRVTFANAAQGITLSLLKQDSFQNTGAGVVKLSGIEAISGTNFADTLTGDDGYNVFLGNGGADRISAGGGNDVVVIGPNQSGDLARGGRIDGGSGIDTVSLDGNVYVTAGAKIDLSRTSLQDTGQGHFSILGFENAVGTLFDDRLTGSSGDNGLYGGSGNDTLLGGAGADVLHGDAVLNISGRNNTTGAQLLLLPESQGNDTLIGGAGADTLYGDGGKDIFRYTLIEHSTVDAADTIADFEKGDRIDLRAIDPAKAFHLGATSGGAGDIVVGYDASREITTLSIDVDGGGADMAIKLTGEHLDLTSADFLF